MGFIVPMDFEKLEKTTDHKELLKVLLPFVDEEADRYKAKHTEWEKNALFYLGKHWIEKKAETDGYLIYEDDDEHFYPVTNYTKKYTNFKLNQFVGKRITSRVKPAGLNPDDIYNARMAHLALRARHEMDEESTIDRLVFLHSLIFGLGWRANVKEPSGESMEVPMVRPAQIMPGVAAPTSNYTCNQCGYKSPDEPICPECKTEMTFAEDESSEPAPDQENPAEERVMDSMGMPVNQQVPIYKPCSYAVDPFRIMVSRALTANGRKWLIDQSMQECSWIRGNFSREGDGFTGLGGLVKKSSHVPRALQVSRDLSAAMAQKHSAIYNTVTSTESKFKNGEETTLFTKIYFYPSEEHERGRLLIFTCDQMLYDGVPDTPQSHKTYKWWHPYTDYTWGIHPMNSEGIDFVGDLIPLNKRINAIDAMKLEYLDKTAAPDEVQFDNVQTNNTDSTDGIRRIKGIPGLPNGGAPFYLQHPQISNWIQQDRENTVKEMEKIAGVPEVVQGLHPEGVDTFRGLKMLRESAEGSEGDYYNRYYEYNKKYNKLKLCLIQECLVKKDPELMEMMQTLNDNEGNNVEMVEDFLGTDMGDRWNIEIDQTDYISTTKAAEEESVRDAITSGIITKEELQGDPLMKFNTLEQLGLGGIVNGIGSDDIKKMNWIIQLLESKKFDKIPTLIKKFDNKPLQLRVLVSWMKKPKFYSLGTDIQAVAEKLREQIEIEAYPPKPAMPATSGPDIPDNRQPPPASPSV